MENAVTNVNNRPGISYEKLSIFEIAGKEIGAKGGLLLSLGIGPVLIRITVDLFADTFRSVY